MAFGSMSDLVWITHRPPTARDGNKHGVVLIPNGAWTCIAVNWERVSEKWQQGQSAWMPAPRPFEPDNPLCKTFRPIEQPEDFGK